MSNTRKSGLCTNFPVCSDRANKEYNKVTFSFFIHHHSYNEVPQDYIPSDSFPTIKKGESPPITKEDEALLHD